MSSIRDALKSEAGFAEGQSPLFIEEMASQFEDLIRVARHAMATRFEIILHGDDPARLRAAAEEALDEIERLDAMLSPYRVTSEICQVNELAAERAVRVSPVLFQLLRRAKTLSAETDGAFDLTVGPLMHCWKTAAGNGRIPTPPELEIARASVGMRHALLNETNFEVRFARSGVRLDVGAIGKGFALERAGGILREAGVIHALLHGGTSTVCALGHQPDGNPWKVAIEGPSEEDGSSPGGIIATVSLREESLSVSAVWGRLFRIQGREYGHIIDPRTGQPAERADLAAVILPSATETDALSTALLIAGGAGQGGGIIRREKMRWLVLPRANGKARATPVAQGIEIQAGKAQA
ncbi:MAG: FAD:protein FMN transferase [Verrucomicrobia bacterium]|nr:FAD:protein FMN transferase [Verrucomicrobiota bacterium]